MSLLPGTMFQAPQSYVTLYLPHMAKTAGQWHALIDCYGRHRSEKLQSHLFLAATVAGLKYRAAAKIQVNPRRNYVVTLRLSFLETRISIFRCIPFFVIC